MVSPYLSDRIQAVMVWSPHKRSFITGFLGVQSWTQYSLLSIFDHCVITFLKVDFY